MSGQSAGDHLDCSRDYIEERAVPWIEGADPIVGKVRYKWFGKKRERRYFVPDLDNLLEVPHVGFAPKFCQAKTTGVFG